MTCHLFNTKVAEKHGVEIAILIHNLIFWTEKNMANGRHFIDGKYWVYNSATAFEELFPYWSAKKIWRLLKKMEDDGLIISANHNEKQYDRTKWYSIIDQWIFQIYEIHFPKVENAYSKSVQPIPDVNTDIVTDTSIGNNRKTKDDREVIFRNQVKEIGAGNYPEDMLKSFCDYWTESKPKGRRLRFEMQRVFDINRRLITWSNRDWNKSKSDTSKNQNYAKGL